MIIHQYVSKAVQDDAPRAGERDRVLLEARRARTQRPKRLIFAAPAERLARLLRRLAPYRYRPATIAAAKNDFMTQRRRVVSCSICDSFSGLRTAYSPVMRPSSMRTARTVSTSPSRRRISAG